MRNVSSRLQGGLLVVLLGISALSACGGSGGGATSDVSGTKRLDALTADEIKKLCDLQAMSQGGYGHVTDCGGGATMSALPNQASCVSAWYTNCAATVAQAEACWHALSCTSAEPLECAPLLPTVCN
jgi:hypothetical protein